MLYIQRCCIVNRASGFKAVDHWHSFDASENAPKSCSRDFTCEVPGRKAHQVLAGKELRCLRLCTAEEGEPDFRYSSSSAGVESSQSERAQAEPPEPTEPTEPTDTGTSELLSMLQAERQQLLNVVRTERKQLLELVRLERQEMMEMVRAERQELLVLLRGLGLPLSQDCSLSAKVQRQN